MHKKKACSESIILFSAALLTVLLLLCCGAAFAAPADPWETGQTTSYDASIPHEDDGALRPGVGWPAPRFTVNGSAGTVTDNLTGLIWLKNANCFGGQTWSNALISANTLASGVCGLSDGSVAGDWRLPNRKELMSLVAFAYYSPAISNSSGTGKWTPGDPFDNVQPYYYWSGTTYANHTSSAWIVNMGYGHVSNNSKGGSVYVWPVRGGQSGSLDNLTITTQASGTPNPVASGGSANLSVTASDSLGHAINYNWTASCPALSTNGSFSSTTSRTPTWTAPSNETGAQQDCTITVTVDDGAYGHTAISSYTQGVSSIAPPTYTSANFNVANIGTRSDEFTVWMDISKDGQYSSSLCAKVMKIAGDAGKTAKQIDCFFEDGGTGRHRITLQIEVDASYPAAAYLENGRFYVCDTVDDDVSDPAKCGIVANTPTPFSVYGTAFDIGAHAFYFKHNAWSKTSNKTKHNEVVKASAVISDYISLPERLWFWFLNTVSLGFYSGSNYYERDTLNGVCYGMASSVIDNFTHSKQATQESPWGIESNDVTFPNLWKADIDEHWDSTKQYAKSPQKPFTPESIYSDPETYRSGEGWTLEAVRKVLYYFASQDYYKDKATDATSWLGQDGALIRLDQSSEDDLALNLLRKGRPALLGVKLINYWNPMDALNNVNATQLINGRHAMIITQLIKFGSERKYIIHDNEFPLPESKKMLFLRRI